MIIIEQKMIIIINKGDATMSLLDGKRGGTYIVKEISLERVIERRLGAMGLTHGTKITVLNNKRSGSVIFKVRGTRLAVGRKIAGAIQIGEAA